MIVAIKLSFLFLLYRVIFCFYSSELFGDCDDISALFTESEKNGDDQIFTTLPEIPAYINDDGIDDDGIDYYMYYLIGAMVLLIIVLLIIICLFWKYVKDKKPFNFYRLLID